MSMYGKYKNVVGPLPVDKWPVTDCSKDPGFTVQADRDDADINKIVSRFMKSGQLPHRLFVVSLFMAMCLSLVICRTR